MTRGALRRVAAPLRRARHRHLPGARQGAGDQGLPAARARRAAASSCDRFADAAGVRARPEAVADRRRRRGHARRARARGCARRVTATRRSSCARAAATSRPGTGGPTRAVTSGPIPSVPIDILGDGFVVAPPSLGEKGAYQIIQGSLADLADLPALRNAARGRGRRQSSGRRRGPPQHDALAALHARRRATATTSTRCSTSPARANAELHAAARGRRGGQDRPLGLGLHRARRELVRARQRVVTTHDEVDDLLHDAPGRLPPADARCADITGVASSSLANAMAETHARRRLDAEAVRARAPRARLI